MKKARKRHRTKMNGSFVGWSSPTANEEMHDASVVQQLARRIRKDLRYVDLRDVSAAVDRFM